MKIDFPTPNVQQPLEMVSIINQRLNMHVGALDAAKEIRDMAKDLCPVSTEETRPGGPHGDLRDSIRAWETQEGATVTAGGVARSGLTVDYAPYVEFGTRNMAAQPFMRPAVDLAHLTQTIHDAIARMMGGLK